MPTAPYRPALAILTLAASAASALAQVKLEPTPPTPLKSPNALIHYTLENPYPLAILLLVLALISFFSLNARDPKKARKAAAVPLLLALATIAAALAITTRREHVTTLTKSLVASVATGDAAGVDRALTPTAKLFAPVTPTGMEKDKIINRVTTMLGPNGAVRLTDYAVLEAQVDASAKDRALVQVKVRTIAEGAPFISWWRLDAVPANNTWQVSGIKFISSNIPIAGIE